MNEKYIQALILGTIIGFAIIIDDFIAPKQNHTMTQKHLMVKDIKTSNWKEDSGKKIELHEIEDHDVFIFKPDDKTVKKNELKQIYKIKIDTEDGNDEESKKEIRIKVNTDNITDVNVESIFEEIQNQLSNEELNKVKSKLEVAKSELKSVITDLTNELDDIDIDIEVEVDKN
ncbi:hypothetical protein N9403_06400 [Gammaproteobacteria bacterium]|nr:hypothetical protein [Gammaproteobacteria bacterium]